MQETSIFGALGAKTYGFKFQPHDFHYTHPLIRSSVQPHRLSLDHRVPAPTCVEGLLVVLLQVKPYFRFVRCYEAATCTYIYTYIHIHIYTQVYIYIHIYIYRHIKTYSIYTYTREC